MPIRYDSGNARAGFVGRFRRAHKRMIAVSALALAVLLSVPFLAAGFHAAAAVTQSEIDALKDDAAALAQEKKSLSDQLDALEGDIDSAMSKKLVVEQEINVVTAQIATTEALIAEYGEMIAQEEVNLADAQERETQHYEEFCQRVRAMEEEGTVTYWQILFNAADFTDLLDRAMMISEVVEYDNAVMAALEQARIDVENAKAALESAQAEQMDAKAALDAQKAELDSKNAAAEQLLTELQEKQDVYESQISDLDSQIDVLGDEIAAKQKEYQAQIEAARKAEEEARAKAEAEARAQAQNQNQNQTQSQTTTGTNTDVSVSANPDTSTSGDVSTGTSYIWPLSGRYTLSSLYGNRVDPFTNKPANHGGIDIPAPYGTSICSAQSGVVIISGYQSSYGNYVVVAHDSQYSTLYAHMSSRAVSAGQSVSQGQVLGYVGSTGRSTGNHLHFELRINNVRADPINLFPNLTLYYSSGGKTVVLNH